MIAEEGKGSRNTAADSAKTDQLAITWNAETAIAEEGKGSKRSDTELVRLFLNNRIIWINHRGAINYDYYRGFYAAKRKGKQMLIDFLKHNGPPTSKGWQACPSPIFAKDDDHLFC